MLGKLLGLSGSASLHLLGWNTRPNLMCMNLGAKVTKILESPYTISENRKRVAILEKMDCNPLYLIIYKSYDNSIIYSFWGTYYS